MSDRIEDEQEWEEIVNEVQMLKSANDNCCLIVEGSSDANLYASFTDEASCEIVIAYGKEKAVMAMKFLNDQQTKGVLSIVDSDFERFGNDNEDIPNMFKTDVHDLETMIILSPALEKVVRELGSKDKIQRNKDAGCDIRKELANAAFPIAVARYFSLETGLNIKFKKFKYKYIDKNLRQDAKKMLKELLNHSQIFNVKDDAFIKFLSDNRALISEWEHFCCGHDLCVMLGKLFQSKWGTLDAGETSGVEMESRLRLAYEREFFRETTLYKKIKHWEQNNLQYMCLSV